MAGIRHPLKVNGLLVVTAPADIDVTTAGQLRAVLLQWIARGHATIVVDMTRTQFCDSAGLTVLVRAHKWAVTEDGELRLVIPAQSAVARIFAITRLDEVIPLFGSLDEALAPGASRRDPASAAAAVHSPRGPTARPAG